MSRDRISDSEAAFTPLEPRIEAELAEALRAAYAPVPIAPERHRLLLEAALEDPLAPPTEDELVESERLRQALEDDLSDHPDAVLARALRAALKPDPSTDSAAATGGSEHPSTSHEASAAARGDADAPSGKARRGNVVYVAFGAAAAIAALAASVALVVQPTQRESEAARSAPAPIQLAQSRSTGELFTRAFEQRATTSRIDRIARAREQDLRHNRYAAWGLR